MNLVVFGDLVGFYGVMFDEVFFEWNEEVCLCCVFGF